MKSGAEFEVTNYQTVVPVHEISAQKVFVVWIRLDVSHAANWKMKNAGFQFVWILVNCGWA